MGDMDARLQRCNRRGQVTSRRSSSSTMPGQKGRSGEQSQSYIRRRRHPAAATSTPIPLCICETSTICNPAMEKEPTAKGGSADKLAEMSTVPCKFTEEDDEILPERVAVDADKDSVNKLKAEKEVAEVILAEKVAHKLLFEVASGKDGKEATISSKRKREELMPDKVCNLNVDLVASFVNKLKVNKEGAFFNKLKVGKEANFSKQPWYMSPETGAHAAGAWGPGQWSSSSPSMPRSGGRYIDIWGKEHGPEDLFVQSTTWFTDENGLRQYLVHFERADQAIIDTAMKPGSQITLETKTHVMTYWRSPSSQSLCMNIGEDLMEFGKRSHWSVVNLGTEITPDNYFLKMKLQGRAGMLSF